MDQACFAAYAQIVQQAFGIQLPPEKKALLESRLFKLFQHEDERLPASCRTATGFLTWLRKDTTGRARKLLSEAITTHHTYFLREEDHFWYFRDVVLPWIAQAAAGRGGATAEHRLSPVQPLDARVPIPKALSCDLLPERHDLLRLGDAHRARTQILRLARARLVAARAGVQGSPGTPMPPGGALPRYTVGPRKGARGQTMRNGRTHSIRLIVMGASTGGTEALAAVLTQLVPPLPPIVIVQHIPPGLPSDGAYGAGRGVPRAGPYLHRARRPACARAAPRGPHLLIGAGGTSRQWALPVRRRALPVCGGSAPRHGQPRRPAAGDGGRRCPGPPRDAAGRCAHARTGRGDERCLRDAARRLGGRCCRAAAAAPRGRCGDRRALRPGAGRRALGMASEQQDGR